MNIKSSLKWITYKKTIIFVITLALLSVGGLFAFQYYQQQRGMKFVKNMGAGWNLGNTFDAHTNFRRQGDSEVFETWWNNPVTTEETFQTLKEAGFQTVRIPVTWYEHMDGNGTINEEWMNRIEEVVGYAYNRGLYIIINIHHDPWATTTEENKDNALNKIRSIWAQIARRFSKYEDHLLFECVNEPRLVGEDLEWGEGTAEAREIVNKYNRAFVDTVRAQGEYNKERYLLVTPYCSSTEEKVLKDLDIPKDRNLIVSIHAYIPYNFALNETGTDSWDSHNPKDTDEMDTLFDNLDYYFISKNIPVIITEFGATDKNNLQDRMEWTEYFKQKADKYNIGCIWWDEGAKPGETGDFQLLDRFEQKWIYPEIVERLVR